MNDSKKSLGILQSRGLGDIVIAIPIAREYWLNDYKIYWPIMEDFVSHFKNTVPWINWIPIPKDPKGDFFYNTPMQHLKNLKVEETLPLYQALTGHPEFTQRPEFQITGFDQIKYHIAQVPFLKKWQLDSMITRDLSREQQLFNDLNLNTDEEYVVLHKLGSDYEAKVDDAWFNELRVVEVTDRTDCIFDWLTVIENATAAVLVDSVFSNLVDQLQLTDKLDCYFIPRSHIHLTPVLGGAWHVIDPDPDTLKRISIFKSS